MIERVALLLTLSLAAVAVYYLLRATHVRRMPPAASLVAQPALLYFRADSCAVCPTQGRIVDQVTLHWDDHLRVETIDAEREPETAARYRVFTLPTTILRDSDGRVRHINYGLADERKLARQLSELVGGQSPIRTEHRSSVVKSAESV